ncbi:MAG: BrnT family toxin [Gammaproteobacteria bacterium]|nr:BrnT family toxin [Gammaproteobacteria bacterium]
MKITWDPIKNRINQRKHRLSFEVAQHVFDDPLHLSRHDRVENGERRWQTLGMVGGVTLLMVAHTFTEAEGEEIIRIVSARKADRSERRIYEQGT